MEIKFGWMGIMDVLHWLNQHQIIQAHDFQMAIIPTVLIPLTALTVALTSLAGLVAGWFGIKLHTEGPKQFLEVLLKKRVLISMLVLNLTGWGIYKGFVYVDNMPSFLFTIDRYSKLTAKPSDQIYEDSRLRKHDFSDEILPFKKLSIILKKEKKFPKGAFRSGVVSGNSIFYGMDDGFIYEIDKKTLEVKRKFFIGKQVTTRPVIFGNKIYAGEGNHNTHHARIYSFDLKTGRFINSFTTSGHTEGQPVIGNFKGKDLIFITAGADGIYALTPELKEVWHQVAGHIDASVSIENGIVYAGTGVEKGSQNDHSYAVAYDYETGNPIWKKELPLSSWMHPVISLSDVCYVLGEIYLPSKVGQFYCLNKTNGAPHFSFSFDSPIASKPVYVKTAKEELVYFSSLSGEVCGINLTKKEQMWCKKTSLKPTQYAFSSLDYDPLHKVLWYPSYDNGLMAITPGDGQSILHWRPDNQKSIWGVNSASVTVDNDHLYQMDLDGRLKMFEIDFI